MQNNNSPFQQIDGEVIGFMRTLQKELQTLVQLGRARYGQLAEGDINVSGRWYDDIPMLARAAADALGFAPGLFTGSPCDSAGLRQLEEEVRISGELVASLEATAQQVREIYNAGRKTLCDWTYGVTDQVMGLEKLPYLLPEQRALVENVAPLVHNVLDARTATKLATKAANLRLKQEGQAETAQVAAQLQQKEQENAVLRGGAIPAPAPEALALAPKKGRRTRRT